MRLYEKKKKKKGKRNLSWNKSAGTITVQGQRTKSRMEYFVAAAANSARHKLFPSSDGAFKVTLWTHNYLPQCRLADPSPARWLRSLKAQLTQLDGRGAVGGEGGRRVSVKTVETN